MMLRKQEPKENGPHWLPRHRSPPPGSASLPLGTSPPQLPNCIAPTILSPPPHDRFFPHIGKLSHQGRNGGFSITKKKSLSADCKLPSAPARWDCSLAPRGHPWEGRPPALSPPLPKAPPIGLWPPPCQSTPSPSNPPPAVLSGHPPSLALKHVAPQLL